jgi:hypothetical protein
MTMMMIVMIVATALLLLLLLLLLSPSRTRPLGGGTRPRVAFRRKESRNKDLDPNRRHVCVSDVLVRPVVANHHMILLEAWVSRNRDTRSVGRQQQAATPAISYGSISGEGPRAVGTNGSDASTMMRLGRRCSAARAPSAMGVRPAEGKGRARAPPEPLGGSTECEAKERVAGQREGIRLR